MISGVPCKPLTVFSQFKLEVYRCRDSFLVPDAPTGMFCLFLYHTMRKIPLTKKQIIWSLSGLLMLVVIIGLGTWFFPSAESASPPETGSGAIFLKENPAWANAQLASMSIEEKVGQLLMICLDGTIPEDPSTEYSLIEEIQPGGICLGPGRLKTQLKQLEQIKQSEKIAPLVGASAEYGLLFPSDTLSRFPLLPGISSISNDSVVVALAQSVAQQLLSAGIHLNFAPDMSILEKNLDDCSEPSYTMFLREFSRKATIYAMTQQQSGIMVCANNYPDYRERSEGTTQHTGSGTHASDSLMNIPYRQLITAGIAGIEVTHAPEIFKETLNVQLTDSLHKALPFQGLVISNFDTYEAYRGQAEPGMAELMALKSGSDMIKVNSHLSETYNFILNAAQNGQLTTEELNLKVKKILLAKSFAGLQNKQPGMNDTLYRNLPWKGAEVSGRKAIASSLILLGNRKNIVPLSDVAGQKTASLCISVGKRPRFTSALNLNASMNHFTISPQASAAEFSVLQSRLAPYTTLIVAVFSDPRLALKAKEINAFMHRLEPGKRMIVVHFGRAESLALLDRFPVMIQSFSDDAVSQSFAAQAIYGGIPLPGHLPLTCSNVFCYGDGVYLPHQTRIKYSIPEEIGIPSSALQRIDSIIKGAIRAEAFPGCQVFISCKGQMVLDKAYGSHTYDQDQEVKTGDLYDLASVTKVAATTLAIMSLYDAGKIRLDSTLDYYFRDLDKNSRGKKVRDSKLNYITVRQLMTHCSGLPSALPIARFISPKWYLAFMMEAERRRLEQETSDTLVAEEEQSPEWMIDTSQMMMAEDSIFKWLFTREQDKEHKLQIGEDFFMRSVVVDSLWELSKQTAVRKSNAYLYSDMNFYLAMKIAETVAGIAIDKYVAEKFYRPMNLTHICYNPTKSFDKDHIVPTEEEKIFRKQLLQGYVHDPTAALLGGVSGNAGLFSNAHDLGILMQMLLNGGTYGGRRYLSEKTVREFTSVQNGGYRGLGWDHQTGSGLKMLAPSASRSTFGHTGFTGTCVWVDPENEIVFVFLSNRVHPTNTNQKINNLRVRQKIQQVIYDALGITSVKEVA